ncbi:toll/interleukin-1 receptor domain-containing protein [Glycomyces buryatensis]|nr:toll/interleukin-1 receptor domain-containing protein [Glycomyces buryatensis]
MSGVFISYRAVNDGYAAPLVHKGLVPVFGEDRVFFDPETVKAGDDVPERIRRRLRASTVLIVEIGPNWFEVKDIDGNRRLDNWKDFVRWEVRKAFKWNLHVVPVLLDGAEFPADPQLPKDIAALARKKRMRLRREHTEADLAALVVEMKRFVPTLPQTDGSTNGGSPSATTVVDQRRSMRVKGGVKNSILSQGDVNVRRFR